MGVTKLSVAQLLEARSLHLGYSDWLAISQPRVDGFAEHTEDRQWIHVDQARAASGPFGGTIVHGYLTLALVPHLLYQVLEITDEVRGVNYGLDKLRFLSPVPVGSEVRLGAVIEGAERRPDGSVMCRVSVVVEVRGQARAAMVADLLLVSYDS